MFLFFSFTDCSKTQKISIGVTVFQIKMKPELVFLVLISICSVADSKCKKGCDLALASYYVWPGSDPDITADLLQCTTADITSYNPETVPNEDVVPSYIRINVPFSCDCIDGEFLGHVFVYRAKSGDTYEKVANLYYANLTTVQWLQRFNSYDHSKIPTGAPLNVTVNCSCGDKEVSEDYGLFVTYPLWPGESLGSVAAQWNFSEDLLQRYNRVTNFSGGSGLVFIPGKDKNGTFPPLQLSANGLAGGVVAGISVAGAFGVLLFAAIYVGFFRRKKAMEASKHLSGSTLDKATESTGLASGASPGLKGTRIDKSVKFSYEELAKATDNFSSANKIGEGGFGSVYYAELRSELCGHILLTTSPLKAAIKKMGMQASREFLAELKVLTRVHHLNLVRLIGYCVEGSLFLVYEYIENGNLSQHLHGTGRDPLPWSTRVQIALDSARGLEYIHENTVPVYVHRDIKSSNILIDKNYRGKVADFGLTKLTEVGSTSLPSRLVGTFGYMPPEYAQYGDVSPKMDVYAFGVILYELISAKKAIFKTNDSIAESRGLVALFEAVPDHREYLCKLVDPRLGDDYPFDSVRKMAQLAKACTQDNPHLRPSMISVVVALMILSSSTEDWDVGSLFENQALVNLMSGS